MIDVFFRWMILLDLPEVLRIELHSFNYPWTEDDFMNCLKCHNVAGMVAESNGKIAGFMIYELTGEEYHLLNFAVSQDFRRQKVGSRMAQKLVGKMRQDRNTVRLEIREKNIAAQKFFSKCGFRAMEVVQDYYENPVEDAYRFFRFLPVGVGKCEHESE